MCLEKLLSKKIIVLSCCILIFVISAKNSLGFDFLIVDHFESPFGGTVGDLAYNEDGYLYVTEKLLLRYGNQVYKIDPESRKYVEFFEHPVESINELKYITSCNGNLYIDHYPFLSNPVIYKIYLEDEIWTTFFEPENVSFGGMACDGADLILTEEDYVYTVSLYDQNETSRNKFITPDSYSGMTWDGEYLWALANGNALHKIDDGIIIEERTLPFALINCRGLTYDGECFWTYSNGLFSPYFGSIVKLKPVADLCLVEEIYGESSPEVTQLRYFRDVTLNTTTEGQELIRLYYEWSPSIINAMGGDEKFKTEIRAVIDKVLYLIRLGTE